MVIRRLRKSHNDTPFGRPTPGWPIGHLGVGHPQGVFRFGVFSYYQLLMLFHNMVCLTVAIGTATIRNPQWHKLGLVGVKATLKSLFKLNPNIWHISCHCEMCAFSENELIRIGTDSEF
jgi:hypothetical protein